MGLVCAELGHVAHFAESSFREILRRETRCYPVTSGHQPSNPQHPVIPPRPRADKPGFGDPNQNDL